MRLTPIDLLNKRFPTALRGYARAAVEDYLREIAADFEATVAENARLRETLEAQEREIARYRAMETTLKEALILAQKTADETRAQAHREAEGLLREAQSRAAALAEDAERRLETVRQQRLRFAREFRATLHAYLDSLEAGEGAGDGGVASRKSQVESEDTQNSVLSHDSRLNTHDSTLTTHDSSSIGADGTD